MPRIYVASLSDYNAGTLHGRWIDAAQDAEDIQAEVQEMLKASPENRLCQWCGIQLEVEDGKVVHVSVPERGPEGHAPFPGNAEEWAIHDYEGFGPLKLSEWDSFARIAAIATLMEAEPNGADETAVAAWIRHEEENHEDGDLDWLDEETFTECYRGKWESEKEYAQEWADSTGSSPGEEWEHHIDWDSYADELFQHGTYWSFTDSHYKVHVFEDMS